MSTTVQVLIDGARNHADDSYGDNYARDNLSIQADGTNKRFRLTNQNIVFVADGSPADLVLLSDNVVVSTGDYDVDQVTGLVVYKVAATAPAQGVDLRPEYYHVILNDAAYLKFSEGAHNWLGVVPTYTAATDDAQIPDLAVHAAQLHMASEAAQKLSSKTNWWYQANAGNKSFNKDTIAAKFRELAKQKNEEAEKARADLYTRHGKRDAPATSVTNIRNVERWQPRR